MSRKNRLTGYNEVYTPASAVYPLVELLQNEFGMNTDWIISEPCERADKQASAISHVFLEKGYRVIETGIHTLKLSIFDLFKYFKGIDMVITNPPYSRPIGDKIIKFLFESGVPFAVLLYGTRVFGVGRHKMYKWYQPAFALFDNRVDFTGGGSPENDNFWLIGNLGNENKVFYINQKT